MSFQQSDSLFIEEDPFRDTPPRLHQTPQLDLNLEPEVSFDSLVQIPGINTFKWVPSKVLLFNSWWHTQSWYKDHQDRYTNLDKHINWGSSSRTSSSWQQFDQGARKSNGEPVVICRKCSVILIHPSIKGSGTSTMSTHLKSAGCSKRSFRRTPMHQSQLKLLSSSPVSLFTIIFTIGFF